MQHSHLLWAGFISLGLTASAYAQKENLPVTQTPNQSIETDIAIDNVDELKKNGIEHDHHNEPSQLSSRFASLKDLKFKDFKVNAKAAQPEIVKDPLQPLNRDIYAFNDFIDRNIFRPVAVQYVEKVPTEVRNSTRLFRDNLGEPWNAVNQVAQGRFKRAAKSLGRFTVNTITTLGLADPARRIGMDSEEDSLGTTLRYHGVPSGPYVVLPFLGPSTIVDTVGRVADSQARPQKYILDGHDRLYYGEFLLSAIDSRSQLLDVENMLQGDRYAAMRDAYLQLKDFQIAEKKGQISDNLFIEDDIPEEEIEQ